MKTISSLATLAAFLLYKPPETEEEEETEVKEDREKTKAEKALNDKMVAPPEIESSGVSSIALEDKMNKDKEVEVHVNNGTENEGFEPGTEELSTAL